MRDHFNALDILVNKIKDNIGAREYCISQPIEMRSGLIQNLTKLYLESKYLSLTLDLLNMKKSWLNC